MGNLKRAREHLKKRYGNYAVESDLITEWVTTGVSELDELMGGGLPKGRIVELYGPESAGKSTMALVFARHAREAGLHVVWLDYENAFTQPYADAMGLPEGEDLIVLKPATMLQGFDMMMEVMQTTPGGLFVLDSLAAASVIEQKDAKDGLEKGKRPVGKFSATLSECMRAFNPVISQYGAILLIINQVRTEFKGAFIVGETTPGGHVLKHYASHRVRMIRRKRFCKKKGDKEIWVNLVELSIKKTKLSLHEGQKINLWVVPGYGVKIAEKIAENEANGDSD